MLSAMIAQNTILQRMYPQTTSHYKYKLLMYTALIESNIQRVTGVSMRHNKPPSAKVLMEGWMVHYTNKSTIVRLIIILMILF